MTRIAFVATLCASFFVGTVFFGSTSTATTKPRPTKACIAAIRAANDAFVASDSIFGNPSDDVADLKKADYPQLLQALNNGQSGEFQAGLLQSHRDALWKAEVAFYGAGVRCTGADKKK